MRVALFLGGCVSIAAPAGAGQPADPAPYNAAVVKFCEAKLGKRVGGGECAHLVADALRVAGAEFTRTGADGKDIPDWPGKDDYVWGTRVKTYGYDTDAKKVTDSDPKAKCRPGDIVQFRDAALATATYPHHTAVVAAVDDAGHPTEVFEQNVSLPNGKDGRVVIKSTLKVLTLTAGKVMVYRPAKPTNPHRVQFTLTNNSKSEGVKFDYIGQALTLGAANTAESYLSLMATGKGSDQLTVGGKAYPLVTRKAYEFYTADDGKVALREVK